MLVQLLTSTMINQTSSLLVVAQMVFVNLSDIVFTMNTFMRKGGREPIRLIVACRTQWTAQRMFSRC